ncbi:MULTISPECIES: hypothetical protein [unclassified Cohnella]|uniref:hypothetical protein n=1 Tax=unclassified Cohnella TaxID=2636738 RepID=UPI003619345B
MIQLKEFLDTEYSLAEKRANEFLAGLEEEQVVNVLYGSYAKSQTQGVVHQRASILIVYKTK